MLALQPKQKGMTDQFKEDAEETQALKNGECDEIFEYVVIGSAGNLSTFGKEGQVMVRKGQGGDGLTAVVLDLWRIQRMLYSHPSGRMKNGFTWTHRLFSYLMCDANSIITTDLVLSQIAKCAAEVKPDRYNEKSFNVYFTGHGDRHGNWHFPNGIVTLQDIVDQLDPANTF